MLYHVRLKQGSRSVVNRIEAKSVAHCRDFFETLTTMQVMEIIGHYNDDTLPPVDDFMYYPLAKFYIHNDESRKMKQIIVHNIKLTKNENDVIQKIKECLEIDGLNVDSVRSGLFKQPAYLN